MSCLISSKDLLGPTQSWSQSGTGRGMFFGDFLEVEVAAGEVVEVVVVVVGGSLSLRLRVRSKDSTPPQACMLAMVSRARRHWVKGHSSLRYLARW